MGKFEKAKERLLSIPKDYTYDEARYLLNHLGFKEFNKGKTSGSRVRFYRARDNRVLLLHKPHPGKIMCVSSVSDLADFVRDIGGFNE